MKWTLDTRLEITLISLLSLLESRQFVEPGRASKVSGKMHTEAKKIRRGVFHPGGIHFLRSVSSTLVTLPKNLGGIRWPLTLKVKLCSCQRLGTKAGSRERRAARPARPWQRRLVSHGSCPAPVGLGSLWLVGP